MIIHQNKKKNPRNLNGIKGFSMAESKGFDGLCPSFASRTPDCVRLRREGSNPSSFCIKNHRTLPKGNALQFLAESKGFEPSKRFWPFTRFPIVLLRPTRTTLHLFKSNACILYMTLQKKSSLF